MQCKAYFASESSTSFAPIDIFAPIKNTLPQKLVDSLQYLKLDPANWIEDVETMVFQSILASSSETIEALPEFPYEPKDAIKTFVWFFRGAAACNGIVNVWTTGSHGTYFRIYLMCQICYLSFLFCFWILFDLTVDALTDYYTFMDQIKIFSLKSGHQGGYCLMESSVFNLLSLKLGDYNYRNPVKKSRDNHQFTRTLGYIVSGIKIEENTNRADDFYEHLFMVN